MWMREARTLEIYFFQVNVVQIFGLNEKQLYVPDRHMCFAPAKTCKFIEKNLHRQLR